MSPQGVHVHDRTLRYSEIDSFTVDETHASPIITLSLTASFSLPITLIVKKENGDEIVEELLLHIPMEQRFSLLRWITHALHY